MHAVTLQMYLTPHSYRSPTSPIHGEEPRYSARSNNQSPAPSLAHNITMPPITRTQTNSLPRGGSGETPTSKPPPLSSPMTTTAIPRRRRLKFRSTHQSQPSRLTENPPLSPPRFTINLSLPPSQRYAEVCHALRDEMRGPQFLFDEVVGGFLPWLPSVVLNWVAWALLWRVYDGEEDGELDVSMPILSTCICLLAL